MLLAKMLGNVLSHRGRQATGAHPGIPRWPCRTCPGRLPGRSSRLGFAFILGLAAVVERQQGEARHGFERARGGLAAFGAFPG